MSDVVPQRHWGWWMRLHEPVPMTVPERLRVHFWANVAMLWKPGVLLASSAVALVPTAALMVALLALDPWRPGAALDPNAIGTTAAITSMAAVLVVWLGAQHFFFVYAMQRWYAPFVRREIARRGTPMCDRCGHRLPPSPPAACPECGIPLPQESNAVSG